MHRSRREKGEESERVTNDDVAGYWLLTNYHTKKLILSFDYNSNMRVITFLTALLFASTIQAFNFGKKAAAGPKLAAPTFNKETERWEKAVSDDGKYPYDALGALLRHGPSPFIARVTNADEYEQGVLKYMAVAKVDRAEATGNMDAKLNNAMDWMYQKQEEKKGKPKVDYTKLDQKQAILTTVWALVVTPIALNVVYETVTQIMSH